MSTCADHFPGFSSAKLNVVGVLLAKILAGFIHVALAECPSGWSGFSSSCYYVNGELGMSFYAALSTCQAQGASVVEITSAEENDYVNSISNGWYIWLYCGDHLVEGEYVCGEDNHPANYTAWGLSKPGDIAGFDCVMFLDGAWSDTNCAIPIPVICEKDAETDLPTSSTDQSMPSSMAITTETPMTTWTTEAPINAQPRTVSSYMRKDTDHEGYCLVDHVIEDIQSSSLIRCLARCMALPSCSSMNVLKERCQLNNSNRMMSSLDFQVVDDCEYFEFLLY